MKNEKRISITKFETALNNDNVVCEILKGTEDVEMRIKKCLTLGEMTEFVQMVVDSCIDAENGEYIPEAYDFAIRANVLTIYANFTLPASIEKKYWLLYNTTAFEQIIVHINKQQYESIISSIDKKIEYMLDIMSSAVNSKMGEIAEGFAKIAELSQDAFKDVDPKDIKKTINGISKMEAIDEEKIAEIILDKQEAQE